jgi:DNA repair exonuclease SbcCD ATPase subunit
VALGLAVAAMACGGGESGVVNRYFAAVNANDTATLSSFAAVRFDKKVDAWKIVSVGPETRSPATLPDLLAKQQELEAELAQNLKEYRAWGNDLEIYPKLERIKSLRDDEKKVPASLQETAEKYDAFRAKDKELKEKVADAKEATDSEKRNTQLSVGLLDDLESMGGEIVSKTVDLDLTIDGQAQPYVMELRKYELVSEVPGLRIVPRWVVDSLDPKG